MRLTKAYEGVTIVLCGAAGQGIATVESLLTKIFKRSGFHIFSTREYMSRVRGGTNSTTIRVSSKRVRAYCDRIDILVPFTKEAVPHVKNRLTPASCVVGDKNLFKEYKFDRCTLLDVDFVKIAEEVGNKVYSNSVAVGVLAGIFKVNRSVITEIITENFEKKGSDIITKNIEAVNRGCDLADELIEIGKISFTKNIEMDSKIANELFLSGRDAIALGAITGGCNYVTFYPMAPATGIGAFLAQNQQDFGIITDQSEDELSVINKAYGAWYAGARALVTTSGGGFALMSEALSLIGITESPMVINLGQRPGPATGMPTRTEQGDLELALYAGHGFFPRILLAPGSLKEAFILTQKAFNLADKFQVPVIILTDQYIVNSMYNLPSLPVELAIEKAFIETNIDYNRYTFTENGISPRGIPGYGKGFVRVDSHTHDEDGSITENPNIRTKSVDKRIKKLKLLKENAFPPKLIGKEDHKILLLGWGSTYHIIKEAWETISEKRDDIAFLHIMQVYPLHDKIQDYLKKSIKTIIIENNPTSQLRRLIKLETGIGINESILKYSGYPFSVEEIVNKIEKLI